MLRFSRLAKSLLTPELRRETWVESISADKKNTFAAFKTSTEREIRVSDGRLKGQSAIFLKKKNVCYCLKPSTPPSQTSRLKNFTSCLYDVVNGNIRETLPTSRRRKTSILADVDALNKS